ncbi:hypothetical protein C8Q76DRAFT_160781 [Earliella scabrosa]|nr:hypothetical protein C8Q76DRAFT_160781 [Earliella scabrosa]
MAISVATARPACPTTISCVKPGKSSLTIKRGLEERLVEEEPDAKRMRFTSQPLADELIITPLDHTIAATAVFQSFGIEVTGNDYCPIIPGLPAPWEKFTEEPLAPVDGGSSSFAPSSSGPEQTSYVPPPIIASSGPTFGYDEFLAGLDPALLDESLPGPSTPSPHAAVAAQKECPNPHAERAMTPPPEEPAAGDMNCAQPTERNPDERPPVEGRAERKKKQVSSPKNSLRATAHKRAHALYPHEDPCSVLAVLRTRVRGIPCGHSQRRIETTPPSSRLVHL